MLLRVLEQSDLESVLDLFCECFQQDTYYKKLVADYPDPSDAMRELFSESIAYSLGTKMSIGVFEDRRLIGFALVFDYGEAREDSRVFQSIFGVHDGTPLPYETSLHHSIQALSGRVIYLLSIAVAQEYRQTGLASGMVDDILNRYEDCNVVSDVSNSQSLRIYEKRNFQINAIDSDYYYIVHPRGTPATSVDYSEALRLILPGSGMLDALNLRYTVVKPVQYVFHCDVRESAGVDYFVRQAFCICKGVLFSLDYDALLQYQRAVNMSQAEERFCGDMIYYETLIPYTERPTFNALLDEMIESRPTEWSLIPDVLVSIPMQYADEDRLKKEPRSDSAETLLHSMDFRTHYEAGIPSSLDRVDDCASLKERIRRYYLGKVKIRISSEITISDYFNVGAAIGPGAYVDCYVSVDRKSNCAVLTWFSLSSPFLVSHLFDNIIRNQVLVMSETGEINFFDYIKEAYGLIKRGTPKIFAVFPNEKEKLQPNQLGSLLFCETIYPEGENLGEIIDEDILAIVNSAHGMGQYDRAFVCAYRNVIMQFSKYFYGSIKERLCEESITLYYIELILFEEAAIHIADREIINLLTSDTSDSPIPFLSKVDQIYDDYAKTIDFWDIKVNYPSSQKSIQMLRDAFAIEEQLEEMRRNQEQLQISFNTKCDIVDRKDSRRMDTSLAIISILAVFSAWIDGYDYIATWTDVFSQQAISALQRVLFVGILITAAYAILHLFGGRVGLFLHKRREKRRRNRKPQR